MFTKTYLFKYVSYAEKNCANVEFPTKVVVDTYLDTIKKSGSNLFATTAVLREFSWYLKIRGFEEGSSQADLQVIAEKLKNYSEVFLCSTCYFKRL